MVHALISAEKALPAAGVAAASAPASVPAQISGLADRARDYAALARAENTRRGYASDWRAFATWCGEHGFCSMPAATGAVLGYLIDRAGALKVSTLRRHLAAIREAHSAAGQPLDTSSPAFRDAWAGIRKAHGQPPNQKRALMTAELRRAVEALPDTLAGKRDRALLLVGFAAALRRSELVGLEAARRDGASWIEVRDEGLVIHLARTKTDQGSVAPMSACRSGRTWTRVRCEPFAHGSRHLGSGAARRSAKSTGTTSSATCHSTVGQ